MSNYKSLFYKASIKNYINFKKINIKEVDNLTGLGPLEFIINFGIRKTPQFKISGTLVLPPKNKDEISETNIYLKGEKIRRVTDP
jgi:hypothetical protein